MFGLAHKTIMMIWSELTLTYLCSTIFLYARSVTSGKCSHVMRSYSDLVDAWADSVCIHQLVFSLVQMLQNYVFLSAHESNPNGGLKGDDITVLVDRTLLY